MKLIKANCRVQFTAEDIQFILQTLGRSRGDENLLRQLISDEECRDLLLDDDTLFRALLEQRGCLRVSHRFYFFVIVRHVLRSAGIEDRGVADYTAELLVEYSQQEAARCRLPGQPEPMEYFFEMLAALQEADDRTRFHIRAHIGNHSLFFSGVFPKRILARAERKGAPGLSYYEALGESSFRIASDHRLAARYDLAPIYSSLADNFHAARAALNDMSERLVTLGDADEGLDRFLLETLSPAK